MNLFCVGLNHHTADVGTRERYARQSASDCALREITGCAEALLLTTCNRVEVYAASSSAISTETIAAYLSPESGRQHAEQVFYRYEADECVQHLFRVASGLDSMVVGETEILGQAKKAYANARASGSAGPYLHRLFQRAFRVAKQVRSRTEITRGAVSVGSVAVDLAQKIFGDLTTRKVLVLGAGETGQRTARALVSRGVSDLRVSNRSDKRAGNLTERVAGRAVPFEGWLEQCREVDILISSTAAPEPLLTPDQLAPIIRERLDRPLFIIDIAVPRDVAPEVNRMAGVFLYDIDSLQSIAEQSLTLRQQQVTAGEAIIADHVAEFCSRFLRQGEGARKGNVHGAMSQTPLQTSEL